MCVHVLETRVPPMLALLALVVDVVLVLEYERASSARSISGTCGLRCSESQCFYARHEMAYGVLRYSVVRRIRIVLETCKP